MAGIGFELKRIFRERSIVSVLKGSFYSIFTVVGPMLIIILGFIAINAVMDYQSVSYDERDLLSSVILYIFVFSLILTSPLSAVVSRYIADKIFDEQTKDIMPCYYVGLLINTVIGLAACAPFCIIAVVFAKVDAMIMFAGGCMFFALLFVFYTMTFVSALKEYKSIALAFTGGTVIAVSVSYLLKLAFDTNYVLAVLIGGAVGFSVIAFTLYSLVKAFFGESSKNYAGVLTYLRRYLSLFATNMFYILGLYISNFVFWLSSEFSLVVANVFISAPIYDTASFFAMLTSISSTVIYTVRVEINFHDRYQIYCQELIGGTGGDIERAETNLFKTLAKELMYNTNMQMILSLTIFLIIMMFGPYMGLGGLLLQIYPSLAAGYFIIFIMYGTIIFLYYFNDGTGALIASFTFCLVSGVTAYFCTLFPIPFVGLSPFCGAFAGWTVAYFRLRYIQRNINAHIFCRGEVIKRMRVSRKKSRMASAPTYIRPAEETVILSEPAIAIRLAAEVPVPPKPAAAVTTAPPKPAAAVTTAPPKPAAAAVTTAPPKPAAAVVTAPPKAAAVVTTAPPKSAAAVVTTAPPKPAAATVTTAPPKPAAATVTTAPPVPSVAVIVPPVPSVAVIVPPVPVTAVTGPVAVTAAMPEPSDNAAWPVRLAAVVTSKPVEPMRVSAASPHTETPVVLFSSAVPPKAADAKPDGRSAAVPERPYLDYIPRAYDKKKVQKGVLLSTAAVTAALFTVKMLRDTRK